MRKVIDFLLGEALEIPHRQPICRLTSAAVGSLSAVSSAAAGLARAKAPSGDTTPSKADQAVTDRLKSAGKLLGIDVLDSLVVGDDVQSVMHGGAQQ